MAASIWIFIKLPQEWWLHIAQLDVTDFLKEDVLGVSVDTSWGSAIGENPWFPGVLAALAIAIVWAVRAALRAAPPADWPVNFDVDAQPSATRVGAPAVVGKLFSWDLLEKVVLISLIMIILAQVLPATDPAPLSVTFAVAFVVVVNALMSQRLASRGHSWFSTFVEFLVQLVVNVGITLVYIWLLRTADEPANEAAAVLFIVLLTLIVILFDRYRPIRVARFGDRKPQTAGAGA